MKRGISIIGIFILTVLCASALYAQETKKYSKTIEFSDSSKPGILIIAGGEGDITITGRQGNEVVVNTDIDVIEEVENEKAKGLKQISGSNFNVSTDEEQNAIIVTRSMSSDNDLMIEVPVNTSLKIGSGSFYGRSTGTAQEKLKEAEKAIKEAQKNIEKVQVEIREMDHNIAVTLPSIPFFGNFGGSIMKGDIIVTNVSGTIEINALEGDITLTDVSGEVSLNTVKGNVEVTLQSVSQGRPQYFSTVEGDIDITLPSNTKANVSLRTIEGEMYTDFDIDLDTGSQEQESHDVFHAGVFSRHGIGNSVSGKINGGGPAIQITTIEGEIYFRQGE